MEILYIYFDTYMCKISLGVYIVVELLIHFQSVCACLPAVPKSSIIVYLHQDLVLCDFSF